MEHLQVVETVYGIPIDALVWTCIAVALTIAEVMTVGFFCVFFAAGALLSAVVSYFMPGNLLVELIVFAAGSVLMLLLARPLLVKRLDLSRAPTASNAQALLNQEVLVIEPVERFKGRVKVVHTGEVWTAYLDPQVTSPDVEALPVGLVGIIVKVDGAKLSIRPQ